MNIKILLRGLGVIAIALASTPFVCLGVFTILRESNTRELSQGELEVIALAARYVSDYLEATESYPTEKEFQAWADDAALVRREGLKSKLPPQWADFSYNPPLVGRTNYNFRIWDGDCDRTWHSEPTGNTKATIDPACYFLFGSKIADLVVSIGASLLLLGVSYHIGKPLISAKARSAGAGDAFQRA